MRSGGTGRLGFTHEYMLALRGMSWRPISRTWRNPSVVSPVALPPPLSLEGEGVSLLPPPIGGGPGWGRGWARRSGKDRYAIASWYSKRWNSLVGNLALRRRAVSASSILRPSSLSST